MSIPRLTRRLPLLETVAVLCMAATGLHAGAQGAVGPASSGSAVADELTYSMSATDSLLFGYYNSGVGNTFSVNGSAAYVSGSEFHPTSFIYEGGYFYGGGGIPSEVFQTFGISQVFSGKKWNITLGDNVSYLPNAPVFGLGGVPGLGDIGSLPISIGGPNATGLLSNYAVQVSNTSSAGAGYRLTGKTSINASGAYSIQRFLDNPKSTSLFGVNNNAAQGSLELNHTLNARNAFGVNTSYMRFLYPGTGFSFNSETVMGVYQHSFTRSLSATAMVGPEWTQSSRPALVPNMNSVAADVTATYARERSTTSASFFRGTNAGSGVLLGAVSNSLNFTTSRDFTREWNGSFTTTYNKSSGLELYLAQQVHLTAVTAGFQAKRTFGRHWSSFASFDLEYQSEMGPPRSALFAINAFTGTSQIVTGGITYSPNPLHLGHH